MTRFSGFGRVSCPRKEVGNRLLVQLICGERLFSGFLLGKMSEILGFG